MHHFNVFAVCTKKNNIGRDNFSGSLKEVLYDDVHIQRRKEPCALFMEHLQMTERATNVRRESLPLHDSRHQLCKLLKYVSVSRAECLIPGAICRKHTNSECIVKNRNGDKGRNFLPLEISGVDLLFLNISCNKSILLPEAIINDATVRGDDFLCIIRRTMQLQGVVSIDEKIDRIGKKRILNDREQLLAFFTGLKHGLQII